MRHVATVSNHIQNKNEEGARRSFMEISKLEQQRWRPPLVDADWQNMCQAIYQGIEGPEWEAVYYHCKDLHQAVKTKKLGDDKKGWSLVVPERSQGQT